MVVRIEVGILWECIGLVVLRGLEVGRSERLVGGEALSVVEWIGREGVRVDRRIKAQMLRRVVV
jgi:hypothetical protein